MTNTATETRSVVVEREMPHPPEKLWRALTQPHLMEEWLMKNDFKPVVGHHFNLRGDWGGVLDCEVLAIEPNKALSYTWNFKHADAAFDLKSVVTFTLTPTRTGTLLRMEQSGFRPDQKQAFGGAKPDGSSSSRSWRRFWRGRTEVCRVALPLVSIKGGLIELEYVDSADPPLAVDRLYGGRHRQLRRHGMQEKPAVWVGYSRCSRCSCCCSPVCTCSRCPMPPSGAAARHRRIGVNAMAGKTSEKSAKAAKKAATKRPARKARPPLRRQSSDREGRRRRARAGLHRGHAGLETRRRAPSRRAHRAHRPRRAQGGQMELALLWRRGQGGWFLSLSLLHEVRQSDFLPRHVAAPCSRPASPSTRKCATSTSTRTTARRSAARRLGEASQPIARRTNVSGETTAMKKATTTMKKSGSKEAKGGGSPSRLIDARIKELGDWRGETLARIRSIIKQADPEVVEEWKWRGVPVWEHDGIICTGETYKAVVKMTFAKGAALEDPSGLFNSSLEGNTRRAIDIHRGRQDR